LKGPGVFRRIWAIEDDLEHVRSAQVQVVPQQSFVDQQRARGHRHRRPLRALGAKWLKIIFVMWRRQVAYDETHHLATMALQALRQREKKQA
jgi:hypothetical protein